ncbi:MAG: sulfotransferase [Actinomycetota bacterium]|nr:sulfotransferase [Actinomycetota bacterium]
MPCPKVLIILGSQRGGTTIFGRLLGEVEGFVYAGEVRRLWLSDPRKPCSCGEPLERCSLWSTVLARVLPDGVTRADVARWQARHVSSRHSWIGALRLLVDGPTGRHADPELAAYASIVRHLYEVLGEVTGGRVIVDASKHPNDAVLLHQLPEVPSYVVQIVRDPRGSAHSVQRRRAVRLARRRRSSNGSWSGLLSDGHSASAALSWLTRHAASEAVRRLVPPERSLFVRYEDLVKDPVGVLQHVAAFVGEKPRDFPRFSAGAVELGVTHSPTSGKRMLPERTPIHLDDQWMSELGRRNALLTAGLAWPLMRRYGYRLRAPGDAAPVLDDAPGTALQQRR